MLLVASAFVCKLVLGVNRSHFWSPTNTVKNPMCISMWLDFSDTNFSVNIQDTEFSCQECDTSFKDPDIFSEMFLLFYPVRKPVLRLWNFSDRLQIRTLLKHQEKKNHSISTDLIKIIIIKKVRQKSLSNHFR